MANKLYQFKDESTGETIKFEGPADATEAELTEVLNQYTNPQEFSAPAAEAPVPVSTPTVSVGEGQDVTAPVTQATETAVAQTYGDTGPDLLDETAAQEYIRMVQDKSVSPEAVSEWVRAQNPQYSGVSAQAIQEYRDAMDAGEDVSNEVTYQSLAKQIVDPFIPEVDPTLGNDVEAVLEEGMAYNPMGIATRALQDLFDSGQLGYSKEQLQELFPTFDDDQIETMLDNLAGEARRRELVNAGFQADERNVNPALRVVGNVIGGASPADVVPVVRGAGFARSVVDATISNALLDAGVQAQDMSYGAQDDFNYAQNLTAMAAGAGLSSAIQVGVRGATRAFTAVRGSPEVRTVAESTPISQPAKYGRKNSKKYKEQLDEASQAVTAHANSLAGEWKNAPNYTGVRNFKEVDGVENDALGVYNAENGEILLNTEAILDAAKKRNIKPETVVQAITFHEGLGHYGLAQKFGEDLDYQLGKMLENGTDKVKQNVQDWLDANPEAYKGDPNREIRAFEEVLADMSNKGQIKPAMFDRLVEMMKRYSRRMGLYDFSYTPKEIETILGMAHSAVVNGKGRDAVANGFRYMYLGERSLTGLSREDTSEFWFTGPDGNERFEIPDNRSVLTPEFKDALARDDLIEGPLTDAFEHPRLFEEYPFLKDIKVRIIKPLMDFGRNIQGGFDDRTGTISITPYATDPRGTMLHEIQHAIQEHEGWPSGGNSKTAISKMDDEQLYDTADLNIKYLETEAENLDLTADSFEAVINLSEVTKWREAYRVENDLWDRYQEAMDTYGDRSPEAEAARSKWMGSSSKPAEDAYLALLGLTKKDIVGDKNLFKDYLQVKRTLIVPKTEAEIRAKIKEVRDEANLAKGKARQLKDGVRNKDRWVIEEQLNKNDELKFEAYEALFGEVEARDTAARQNLDYWQRMDLDPYASQKLPEDYYIYDRSGSGGLSESVSDPRYMRLNSLDEIEGEPGSLTNDELMDVMGADELLTRVLDDYTPTERTWAEAKRDVNGRGLTLSSAMKKKPVEELDRRLFQYDAVGERLNDKLTKLHAKMNDGTFTPRDKATYLEALFEYSALAGRIFDDQAEVGRALNAMKALQLTKRRATELNRILKEYQGNKALGGFADDTNFMEFAENMRYMLEAGNVDGAGLLARQSLKPYWWQYILSLRHAMMLSGIGTHAKNTMDNANMILRELEETVLAVPGDVVRKGLIAGGRDTQRGVTAQEAVGRFYGLIRALFDSQTYMNTLKAFKEGHGASPVSATIEMQDARIPGLGKVNDALFAADIFFRSFHDNANLHAFGVRQAISEGFSGARALEEGSAKAANPTEGMLSAVKAKTDEALLVDTPSFFASRAEAMKAIRPNMSGGEQLGAFAANILFPFFRVTDRLLFQAIRRSPLSILDKNTRADFLAGGARRDIAIARTAYGSALIYYYWQAAGEGEVIGEGPSDYKKRQALEAGGWRANSTLEDGTYFDATALNLATNPLDTQNAIATNIASIREAWERGADKKDIAERLGAVAMATTQILSSQSYAENLAQYMAPANARTDSEQETAWANFAGGIASSFVPAAARQANQQYFDPVKRDTRGDKSFTDRVTGRIKSGIPGLSEDLPARYDLYGDVVPQGRSTFGMDNYSNVKTDPVSVELQKVEQSTDKTVVTGAPASFQYEGQTVKLPADAQQEWQRVQGGYIREYMQRVISHPSWKTMPLEEKIEVIKEVRTKSYQLTKEDMLPLLGLTTEE